MLPFFMLFLPSLLWAGPSESVSPISIRRDIELWMARENPPSKIQSFSVAKTEFLRAGDSPLLVVHGQLELKKSSPKTDRFEFVTLYALAKSPYGLRPLYRTIEKKQCGQNDFDHVHIAPLSGVSQSTWRIDLQFHSYGCADIRAPSASSGGQETEFEDSTPPPRANNHIYLLIQKSTEPQVMGHRVVYHSDFLIHSEINFSVRGQTISIKKRIDTPGSSEPPQIVEAALVWNEKAQQYHEN